MPEEKKKFYLTREGLNKIKKEYEVLKKSRISKSREEFPKIWHSEDIDPEYLSFQENLDFLESRIAELEYILKNAFLIKKPPKEKQNIVHLGARVTVEVNNQVDELEIVSSLEANPSLGRISNESPVGQALLGRRVGEEVVVSSPVKVVYKIKKIRYLLS